MDHGDDGPLWRDVAPSALMVLPVVVAVMTVLALVWTYYVGALPVEP